MVDPSRAAPGTDAGSDTFSRYSYQAHVAVAFCADSAVGGTIECVVLEHFEDIALESDTEWRMLQVKTRDGGLGPWKLSHLLNPGGALHSLARSFRVLGSNASYEVVLEGATASRDGIQSLRTPEGRQDTELQSALAEALSLDDTDCAAFCERLRLRSVPGRTDIVGHNLRILGGQAPYLSHQDLVALHERVLSEIYRAMTADRLESEWPRALLMDATVEDEVAHRLAAKRLTREQLTTLLAPLAAPPRPLLRRVVDPSVTGVSTLEEKLLAGGAPSDIIEDAKNLRANAALREAENAASALWQDDAPLEDVRERLRIRVNGMRARHGANTSPAVDIWNDLLQLLGTQAATLDSRRLFHQDPDFLLGEVCQMADLCITDFGIAHA